MPVGVIWAARQQLSDFAVQGKFPQWEIRRASAPREYFCAGDVPGFGLSRPASRTVPASS